MQNFTLEGLHQLFLLYVLLFFSCTYSGPKGWTWIHLLHFNSEIKHFYFIFIYPLFSQIQDLFFQGGSMRSY